MIDQLLSNIEKEFNLNVSKYEKISRGSADLYKIYCGNEINIVKVYQPKYKIDDIKREYYIFQHLKQKGFNIPIYKMNKDNEVYGFVDNRIYIIQKFIDGNLLSDNQGNNKLLRDTSINYANIVLALSDLNIELPEYNKKFYDDYEIDKAINNIQILKDKCVEEYIRKQLKDKEDFLKFIKTINKNELMNITYKNSHGDYTHFQFIYDESYNIKVTLDFITAKKMPLIYELVRSFIYLDPSYKNGEFDIKGLIRYIAEFNHIINLNEYDLLHLVDVYFIEITKSIFGYKQYIENKRYDYLNLGINMYKQAKFIYENYDYIKNMVKEIVIYEKNSKTFKKNI